MDFDRYQVAKTKLLSNLPELVSAERAPTEADASHLHSNDSADKCLNLPERLTLAQTREQCSRQQTFFATSHKRFLATRDVKRNLSYAIEFQLRIVHRSPTLNKSFHKRSIICATCSAHPPEQQHSNSKHQVIMS
jgi:hypothetical protein